MFWNPKDRKSTRLNSSHLVISYAVFCLKKKSRIPATTPPRGAQPLRRPTWQSASRTSSRNSPVGGQDCSSSETPGAFFFFNDTAPPEIYTLSLPDALPI